MIGLRAGGNLALVLGCLGRLVRRLSAEFFGFSDLFFDRLLTSVGPVD